MADTEIVKTSKSKRVPIIAAAVLLVIVAFLIIQKKFPLGSLMGGSDAKPAVEAKAGGAPDKPAAAPSAAGDAKPAAGGAKPAAGGPPATAAGKPPPVPVRVAQVKQAMMTDDVSAVGTVLAEESVIIRPEIAGRVTKIHFDEGQMVSAGAPLVSIDPDELNAQLSQSAADVSLNKQRRDRAQNLYRKNFISRQAIDEANSNLERAAAERQETLAKISKTEIRAPFKGVVGLRKISAGAYVRPGDDIVRLEDIISSVKLDFRVPETFLDKIHKDQEVNLHVDAFPKDTFSGKIFAIEPLVDEQTRAVLLRARIPNKEGKLRAGMFARVTLILEQRGTALVIPEQAIVPKGNAAMVVKVVDGKAEFVPVKIGKRRPGEVEILEGLTVNDVVVTDGQGKLQPGAAVMVMGASPPAQADGAGEKKS